ncbi:ABC transporter ATP-binding protein [Rhodoferax sp.]|uniref:ABC transporter ATP-binding protein n=1 Tax=Rhodoferax sp. TaxID=50421 RepID=UPI002730AFEC|nr:oligopeptide/dipeptide ABC transporter ATP-binding protein [Rhodoferax sp.]MDP1529656.1 ATP-binding cassette domain-containing protein [Rhodoferax sp.]MDP1945366.1 ATP-binding cassette domain-containing protein [Rhodoferax sp.]MDP2441449.1 ATP-binding cassette domain-containing protein [Rhodoferax sp.]MDP3863817.1 ATP-binding cassette domain-containing protein [Rhodoferax sp.]MDZ4207311.1 oligopeptide/dipeptide ABC transporter ATP-binding protein [Rhodoferax sp.]
MNAPLLRVEGLVKHFERPRSLAQRLTGEKRSVVHALNGVTLEVQRGETLGLIGESGCGKSTLGRSILRLVEPSSGRTVFDGQDLSAMNAGQMMRMRARLQIIFQDPYASLNPRKSIREIVSLPLQLHGSASAEENNQQVEQILQRVGFRPDQFDRYPHQFSGGQRQRIGIARALVSRPALVVCDEPVSALDVSIKAQILELLGELKAEFNLTYIFVSHDIAAVGHLADRIAVMYLGEIVEIGRTLDIINSPQHPYTQALLSAVPRLVPAKERTRTVLSGDLPSPLNPPSGCKFHTRCPVALPECSGQSPRLKPLHLEAMHSVACLRSDTRE